MSVDAKRANVAWTGTRRVMDWWGALVSRWMKRRSSTAGDALLMGSAL